MTHKEYLALKGDGLQNLIAYYSQFARHPTIMAAARPFVERCRNARPDDEHFNKAVPLCEWDRVANSQPVRQAVACVNRQINNSSTWSNCEGVCALKTAVRLCLKEEDEQARP
jgi:hypothetical protein